LQAKSHRLHSFCFGVLLCACQTPDWNFGFWVPEDLEIPIYSCRAFSIFLRETTIGNMILVKLELWESVMVIISFGLPLTYLRYASAKCGR
jgi:hypothetical protein